MGAGLQLDKRKRDKLAYINPELAKEAKERGNDAFRAQVHSSQLHRRPRPSLTLSHSCGD